MSSVKGVLKYLKSPGKIVLPLAQRGFLDWMDDKTFLKLRFWGKTGRRLNLEHPRTYNEKLQWLKLYDRNPVYPQMVDKYRAKEYVASLAGEEYIIPTLGIYDSFEEIDFEKLPEQFVLKCTHDSHSIYICRNRDEFDRAQAEKILKRGLRKDPYRFGREWPYSQVQPRIIAEQYMEDESHQELKDYKFFTFSGKAAMILVDYGRFSHHGRNLYSLDWEYLNASIAYPGDPLYVVPRPEKLELMIELAERLGQNLPHVRVDLYSIGSRIYFGEMTLYPGGGFSEFKPRELELRLGDLLVLPRAEKGEN